MKLVKFFLRIAGFVSFALGITCLPLGYGINPKRDLSAFNNLADTGVLVTLGLILMAIGAVLLLGSWLLPGQDPDDFA